MSQIAITVRLVTSVCAVLLVVTGCGTPNEKSAFDPDRQKHAADWVYAGHAGAAQAQATGCAECHGADLLGGVSKVSCSECHPAGPAPMSGCSSCHEDPPSGTAAPNRRGVHRQHDLLPNVTGTCATCHSGAGSMTANHYNGIVEVAIQDSYDAKSGPAVRNGDGTCSKVSCHGGQTTPAWLTGLATIDVNNQCYKCHAYGTAEDNSYVSGKHDYHVNIAHFPCTWCHDAGKLAADHFTTLNTNALEGLSTNTMLDELNWNKYNTRTCSPICHSPRPWDN